MLFAIHKIPNKYLCLLVNNEAKTTQISFIIWVVAMDITYPMYPWLIHKVFTQGV